MSDSLGLLNAFELGATMDLEWLPGGSELEGLHELRRGDDVVGFSRAPRLVEVLERLNS
jgi:hypothetical protein